MLQWQNGQLVTVWPEEFTTNRAKWIPLGALGHAQIDVSAQLSVSTILLGASMP